MHTPLDSPRAAARTCKALAHCFAQLVHVIHDARRITLRGCGAATASARRHKHGTASRTHDTCCGDARCDAAARCIQRTESILGGAMGAVSSRARPARERDDVAGGVSKSTAAHPFGELCRALHHVCHAQRCKESRQRRRRRQLRLHGWSNDCGGGRRCQDRSALVCHALVLAAQHPRAAVVRRSCARRRRSSQRPRPAPALRLRRTAAGKAHCRSAVAACHDATSEHACGHQQHAGCPPAALHGASASDALSQ